MIAKLSEDLILELDRNGHRPLAVEDPRTHRRYVLMALDENESAEGPTTTADMGGEWSESKNVRRFALIDQEIAGSLTPLESIELTRLQLEMDAYLRQVAPLPIDATRRLHAQLLKLSSPGVRP